MILSLLYNCISVSENIYHIAKVGKKFQFITRKFHFTTPKINFASKTQLFNGSRVYKFDYRIDWNRFRNRLPLHRHKLGTNKFDEITAVEDGAISRMLYDTAAESFRSRWNFIVRSFAEIIVLIEEEYHGRFFFFPRDLTERDRDMAREVKVFIGWSFSNGIWSRLVRPRRTIERPIFIILFYSSVDYHSRRFTSIARQALRKTAGRKKGRFRMRQIDVYKLVWNYREEFLFIEYAS